MAAPAAPAASPSLPAPTPPPTMTAEEFGRRYAGYAYGQVRRPPMPGTEHGKVTNLVAYRLTGHVLPGGLGHVFINDTFVRVPTRDDPDRVYGSDVCYVPYAKLPKDADLPDGVLPVTPDLVVEVRSPSDTGTEAFGKVLDYLGAGVPVAVLVDPTSRSVSVCGEPFGQRLLGPADTLTLPEALPGFAVPVAALFEG